MGGILFAETSFSQRKITKEDDGKTLDLRSTFQYTILVLKQIGAYSSVG